MSNRSAGPVRNLALVRRFSPPGAVWAAALFTAPFLNDDGATALIWGIGAVVLIALFPWALVTVLDKRGDLRRGINRLGASPIILGAFGAAFMVLRLIRWTGGPQALAAVVFGMIAAYALTIAVTKAARLEWADVTYAASAVVLPVLLYLLFPGAVGALLAATAAILCVAALLSGGWATGKTGAAAAVGVLAGGGVFLWLLAYSL
ncbi:hypothetical protein [Arthrobacter gengyunqii]|uniref:Yip1 domain-containing protein n=1 Tax=Arthrobacter gengyunqii TaxID=2886940 RepID=A0ABS8GI05_9MICC|nr:hypothetical protein [Arthrobacter gengyunqii]MCC3265481.1 hypothetical protein [Arthrobacter gengyunqii]